VDVKVARVEIGAALLGRPEQVTLVASEVLRHNERERLRERGERGFGVAGAAEQLAEQGFGRRDGQRRDQALRASGAVLDKRSDRALRAPLAELPRKNTSASKAAISVITKKLTQYQKTRRKNTARKRVMSTTNRKS
jgi:hypothetical protein